MVEEDKVGRMTRLVEVIATIGSFLLVLVTLPFSLCFTFKVVREYERAVVFRMGRLKGGAYGPGTFFVMPCVDNCVRVDLRTVSFDVPPQEVLTKDSVTVSVDAVVYYRIKEPLNAVVKIANYSHSTRLLAASTLRTVLGTRNLAEILSERETISHTMQTSLDEATDPWGVKVERVEIKDVRLPVQLQRAMATEAEATREARAKVIAAEGEMLASRALKEASDVISTSPAALQSNPFTTRRAALRSRASNRIRMLARPKYVNRKYDPTVLMWTMRFAPNQEISEYLAEQLWQFENSRYQRYRVFCNARLEREARRRQRAIAKLRKSLSTPEDWDRHMEVLKRLAVPKVAPRPKGPERRRKWRPINVQRLEELAQPVPREEPEVRDPFVVPESALNYEISRRIMEIAFPKHTPDIVPPRIPGAVSRAALKAVASPRTIILAKPAERPAGMETDLREDAFTVSPAALKARCTKRIKMLARPKTYGR